MNHNNPCPRSRVNSIDYPLHTRWGAYFMMASIPVAAGGVVAGIEGEGSVAGLSRLGAIARRLFGRGGEGVSSASSIEKGVVLA